MSSRIFLTRAMEGTMPLSINEFKPYVPAKNFEISQRFYCALGFNKAEGWGGTVDFELNGYSFRLQDYYVKQWAENFMVVIGVDDAHGWYAKTSEMEASKAFPGMGVKPVEIVETSLVLHVSDPSGVLLVCVQ